MVTQTNRLRREWREAWQPRQRVPIVQWAPERFYLNRQYEASAGPYNLRDYPYLVEILQAWEDATVEKITIMASTQVGKTLFVQVALAWAADQDPAPSLICMPNQAAAIEFRDRFYANSLESPALREAVPHERKWNTRHIDMGSCRIYLAWAGSRQRLRGRACRNVVLSEVDVYNMTVAGNPIRVAEERTKKFYRRKIVQESSPVGEDSVIAAEYEAGDKRKWHARCPECGKFQELRFFTLQRGELAGRGGVGGYRDDEGELLPVDQARSEAHYVCVTGCRIRDDQKATFIAGGRWVREGQLLDKHGNLAGEPKRSSRHTSFHLWSIHSGSVTFGDIVEAYIRHHEQGQMADFWQNWLGMKHSTARKVPRWERVGQMLVGVHPRCTVDARAWFLTAGCDVQENGVYYVVRGWGHDAHSWLVDWGFIPRFTDEEKEGRLASDLAAIQSTLLERRWPIHGDSENPLGKKELGVRLLGIDAGYRQEDVYAAVRTLNTPRARAIVGDTHTTKTAERFRKTTLERTRRGHVYRGGFEVWRVNVNVYKEDVMQRLVSGCDGQAKTWWLTSDIGRFGREYLRQLVNEHKRIEEDRYGRKRIMWTVRSHTIGNHHWDDEIYCRALADMVLAEQRLDWNSSNWPRQTAPGREEPRELVPSVRE